LLNYINIDHKIKLYIFLSFYSGGLILNFVIMAHRKAGGSTQLGRDSESKRLGVKLFGGQSAQPGSIIVKQRGTKFAPGENTKRGSDDTIYAVKSGRVQFCTKRKKKFNGQNRIVKIVNIIPT